MAAPDVNEENDLDASVFDLCGNIQIVLFIDIRFNLIIIYIGGSRDSDERHLSFSICYTSVIQPLGVPSSNMKAVDVSTAIMFDDESIYPKTIALVFS
jgi:hypothetical protein